MPCDAVVTNICISSLSLHKQTTPPLQYSNRVSLNPEYVCVCVCAGVRIGGQSDPIFWMNTFFLNIAKVRLKASFRFDVVVLD